MNKEKDAALALSIRAKFVRLATNGMDGTPDIRVMFNLKKATRLGSLPKAFIGMEYGFATYLGTNASSRKTAEGLADPRCALYYEDTRTFEGLCVYGRLESVDDRSVKASLWKPSWGVYYPGGLDGGDFQVFRFVPGRARYYHSLKVTEFDA